MWIFSTYNFYVEFYDNSTFYVKIRMDFFTVNSYMDLLFVVRIYCYSIIVTIMSNVKLYN